MRATPSRHFRSKGSPKCARARAGGRLPAATSASLALVWPSGAHWMGRARRLILAAPRRALLPPRRQAGHNPSARELPGRPAGAAAKWRRSGELAPRRAAGPLGRPRAAQPRAHLGVLEGADAFRPLGVRAPSWTGGNQSARATHLAWGERVSHPSSFGEKLSAYVGLNSPRTAQTSARSSIFVA